VLPLLLGAVQEILTFVPTNVVVAATIVEGIDCGIKLVVVETAPHP